MNTTPNEQPEPNFSPLAFVLAWLWPGLGHISLGERRRGILIMAGILFLFMSGLLIGGVDAVDRRNDKLWYYAQVITGPIAIGADWMTQHYVKIVPPDELGDRYRQGDPDALATIRRTGLGKINEMGTLFCALAGLMNLIVMLDALQMVPRTPLPDREIPPGDDDSGGAAE